MKSISSKTVKKIFAIGLMTLSMSACAGNSDTVQEKAKVGKNENIEESNKNIDVDKVLKDIKYDKGDFSSEESEYNSVGFKSLSDDETKNLREGDVITSIPNRKILEEKGLDFVFVYDVYSKKANEDKYPDKPQSNPSFRYNFEFEQKEIDIYDKSGKLESTSMLKCSREIEIVMAKYKYIEDLGKWGKALYLDNTDLYINGKIYNEESFAKDIVKQQETK